MRRRGRAVAIAVAVLTALVVSWQSRREPTAVATARAPAPAASTATPIEAPAPAIIPIAVASDEPLPPADQPLAEIHAQLSERARKGDRRAACRLALDTQFCRANPVDSQAVAFFEQAIAQRPNTTPGDIAYIARLEAQHARALAMCRDLAPGWAEDQAWRWQLLTAQLGDDGFAAWYATAPAISRNDFIERPEPWQIYRVNALPLLQRAVAAGDVRAIWQMRGLLRGERHLEGMPGAVPPDARQADVYGVALRGVTAGGALRELEDEMAESRARWSADEWRAIEDEGNTLARRHFAGQAPMDFSRGIFRDVIEGDCDD